EAVPGPGLAAGVALHAARTATAVPASPCKKCRRVIAITVPPGGSIRRLYPWGDTPVLDGRSRLGPASCVYGPHGARLDQFSSRAGRRCHSTWSESATCGSCCG